MKKNVWIYILAFGILTACQNDDEMAFDANIESINPADLPVSSQLFIDDNFTGEIITDAFRIINTDGEITYESFISNNTNLVFKENSKLFGFGNVNSRLEMEDEMLEGDFDEGMHGNDMKGGKHQGGPGCMLDSGKVGFRDRPDLKPVEIDSSELPATTIAYLNENYPNKKVLKVFLITFNEIPEYHVLLAEVGGLRFDKDGNFVNLIIRHIGPPIEFEELAIEDLPDSVISYIEINYPDNKIVKARIGKHDEVEEFHVLVDRIGVLIFDADGNFLKLLERRRPGHHRG